MKSQVPFNKVNFEVFLGGISAHSTEDSIKSFVERTFGPVEMIEVPMCTKSQQAKGFAKIKFQNPSDTSKALKRKHIDMNGLKVAVKPWVNSQDYQQNKEETSQKKLYVRFPKSVTEHMLHQYFTKFGKIEVIDVKKDINSLEQRCFCYITFQTKEAAVAASMATPHRINSKKIRCKLAVPSDKIVNRERDQPLGFDDDEFFSGKIPELLEVPFSHIEALGFNGDLMNLGISNTISTLGLDSDLRLQMGPYLASLMSNSNPTKATLVSISSGENLPACKEPEGKVQKPLKKKLRLPRDGALNFEMPVSGSTALPTEVSTRRNLMTWLALQHNRDIDHSHEKSSNLVFRRMTRPGARMHNY